MNQKKEKVVTLDLINCKNWLELHERIRVAFDFPDFYGKNWDAFWDLLRSECDADRIVVLGENTLPKDLESDKRMMREVLQEFQAHIAQYGWSVLIDFRDE